MTQDVPETEDGPGQQRTSQPLLPVTGTRRRTRVWRKTFSEAQTYRCLKAEHGVRRENPSIFCAIWRINCREVKILAGKPSRQLLQ